jgi:hypothetical protein
VTTRVVSFFAALAGEVSRPVVIKTAAVIAMMAFLEFLMAPRITQGREI